MSAGPNPKVEEALQVLEWDLEGVITKLRHHADKLAELHFRAAADKLAEIEAHLDDLADRIVKTTPATW